ncbi:DNA polymerase Y family protein [Vibrio sp. SCSIO 43136]|uniref:Y-family DNA polymerase n=1 Tax=Vibrio sp. SCSIO 43136 TaxID=2819101 RepID=UPI002074B30F|nr:DNA polymerase Y family protein [Vibrio sp. SCSIO 43136]USD66179.1 DNA polymerase Y family protein [Vibrio sp. SCSIO 43136]
MALWLYLYFPYLQLDTLCPTSEQDQQAVLIVDGQNNHIVQASTSALSKGINIGMGIATAASLCPDLKLYPYMAQTESTRLKEIAQQLYLVTSDIVLKEPNGLLLKVSDMLTLYTDLPNYWQVIQSQLTLFQCRFHYATAYSSTAAELLACNGYDQLITDENQLKNQLRRYAINHTHLEAKAVEKLNRVGVRRLGDLLDLPWAELAKRFDHQLVTYLGRLLGQFHEGVNFYHPPQVFHRQLDLLYELENLQHLNKPLFKLLKQLEHYLKRRDMLALGLTLSFGLRDGEELTVTIQAAQGEYLAKRWWQLAELKFESVKLSSPVLVVKLEAGQLIAQSGQGQDMFVGQQGEINAHELLSILQAKLGDSAVQGICLADDPRPEKGNRVCSPLSKPQENVTALPMRPSVLLSHPAPLKEKVTLLHGPERIATGWWDDEQVVRDYFIARTDTGRWLWVYRTPAQQWFLHGLFS